MGYGVHRFVSAVDPNLLCGVCNGVLEEAILTPCGHSFCQSCIDTWLCRPDTATCPMCRGPVYRDDIKPVHAIRNLINNADVECEYMPQGCKVVMTLERLLLHQWDCPCQPVTCAGCDVVVNRSELLSHQSHCGVIVAAANHDRQPINGDATNQATITAESGSLFGITARIVCLEQEVRSVKRQLRVTESRNRILEREYEMIKTEVERRRGEIFTLQYQDFASQYEYGQEPESVATLSLFLARFIRDKPSHIDRDRVFEAIKGCYDRYSRSGDEYENDVFMLLATAYASNWFSENQTVSLDCWLQSIARYRQYASRTMIRK